MKSKKHQRVSGIGAGSGAGSGTVDVTDLTDAATASSTTPTATPTTTTDAGIAFLYAKFQFQENRIDMLEELVQAMAQEIEALKSTPKIDTQNNTTNNTNVNLLLQLNVDNQDKLDIGGSMRRIPNLPDTVREQLENALPTSINTLFAKNNDMNRAIEGMGGSGMSGAGMSGAGMSGADSESGDESEGEPEDTYDADFYNAPTPRVTLENLDEMIADETIRESIRRLMIEEEEEDRECARECAQEVINDIVEKVAMVGGEGGC